MKRWLLACSLLVSGCGPAHLGTLSLSGERNMQTLLLGGWDGHRLVLFNDATIEPQVTTPKEVARSLSHLSSSEYAAIYFESSKLQPATAAAHSLLCPAPACIAVLERKGGSSLEEWGEAVAIVELKSLENEPIGSVWLNERAIRPPGPKRWALLCRNKQDPPRYVHADGGAIFPAQSVGKVSFALFGPRQASAEYQSGFATPSETQCDEEIVRREKEPQPERPLIKADPALMRK